LDITIDLRILLTIILLLIAAGALWRWARPVPSPAALTADTLASLLAHAPVAMLWLNVAGELQVANVQARTLLGIGPTASNLPAEEWRTRLLEDVQAVLAAPSAGGRSRTLTLPDQRTWQWWVTAWNAGALVVINDMTTLQQAEQATHLLLSDLAHELRTPLATLATHLEVLRLPTIAPEMRQQSMQFIGDEMQRLVRLVNNTLELGRLQSNSGLERRPLQLLPLVEAVVAMVHGDAQAKGVAVSVEAAAALPAVLGNADRLKQVLLNLVDNSIKYGRSGDRVDVTLTVEAGGVACAVWDSGPGIAPADLPHVTRRFYRAVPAGLPGNGLGLALAAEIVRQHGAQLTLESRSEAQIEEREAAAMAGSGTCVRFVLPIWHVGENV
jgi:signal transduction histidine kinase